MNQEMSADQKRCQATTKRGHHCRAPVDPEHEYCSFHRDPGRAAELGRKGGLKNRHYIIQAEEPGEVPQTATDVKTLLADVMAQLRAGRLDPKIATSIAYVAGPLLKIIELADLEARLSKLEEESKANENDGRD